MDYQEVERLKKVYDEMSDEALVEMSQAQEDDYQEGVYALIIDEIKKRGLEGQPAETDDEVSIDFESPDGRLWVEIYRYDDEVTKMRLEEFFKELGVAFVVLPYSTRLGQPTGKGSIRVREDCFEQAEKVICDLEEAKQFPKVFMDEEVIKDSIVSVLNDRNIADSENIAEEMIERIKKEEK